MIIESKSTDDTKRPPVYQLIDERLHRVAMSIGVMLIVGGSLWAVVLLWPLINMIIRTFLPFAAGLVFAYVFDPVVTFVQVRLKLSRVGGVLILYTILGALIVGFFASMLPVLVIQIQGAYDEAKIFFAEKLAKSDDVQRIVQPLKSWLGGTGIVQRLEELMSKEGAGDAAKTAAASGVLLVLGVGKFLWMIVQTTVGFFVFFVMAVLVNIYLLIDFSKMRDVLEVVIPVDRQPRTFDIMRKVDIAVGGFIRGMVIDATLVGILTFIGMYFLGLRYALLIGVMAGIGNFIPYFGPILAGAPAVLYVLIGADYDAPEQRWIRLVTVLAYLSFVQFMEGFVFQPKIVGKNAQLHPIVVLLALAIGANFGILGMVVAVPCACIARVLLKEFYWDKRERNWKERTGKLSLGYVPKGRRKLRERTIVPPLQ
ncbi:AI-2E family transporter [soil metagenome]